MKKLFIILLLLFSPCCVYGQGCDSNTRFLAHFDEADGSTSMTEENCDGSGAKTITAQGNAETDDGVQKWDNTLLLPGTDDYVETPHDADLDSMADKTESWTIDFWTKIDSVVAQMTFYSYYDVTGDSCVYRFSHRPGVDGVRFYYDPTVGATITTNSDTIPNTTSWHHLLFYKEGGASTAKHAVYLAGSQSGYNTNAGECSQNSASPNYIGSLNATVLEVDGNMDEFRIYEGNPQNCTIDSDGTSGTCDVPAEAYSSVSSRGRLLLVKREMVKQSNEEGYWRLICKQPIGSHGWNDLECEGN